MSDNGSAYIAKPTAKTAAALGQTLLFAPIRSPESNGLSERFVKSLKRYYARATITPDAATILPNWIEDYCEVHPHSGSKLQSPREFMRLSAGSNSPPVRGNGVHTTFRFVVVDLYALHGACR